MARTDKQAGAVAGVRLDAAVIAEIDALAVAWSRPGATATRSDVVRVALRAALDAWRCVGAAPGASGGDAGATP